MVIYYQYSYKPISLKALSSQPAYNIVIIHHPYLFFQRSFIALSCLLLVAAATAQNNLWKKVNRQNLWDYKFQSQAAPKSRTEKAVDNSNSYSSNSYASNSYTSDGGFNWNWGSIMEYVSDPWLGLEKAQYLLEELDKDLPGALEDMDPAIKEDIKQVNILVVEICDKAVKNAKDNGFNSYYSPSSMKKTCAFINKHVPEISRGLDDPSVITNIIAKLRKFGDLSKQMSDLFDE